MEIWARTRQGRPQMRPMPESKEAQGEEWEVVNPAKGQSSSQGLSGSRRRATRSRARSWPRDWCREIDARVPSDVVLARFVVYSERMGVQASRLAMCWG